MAPSLFFLQDVSLDGCVTVQFLINGGKSVKAIMKKGRKQFGQKICDIKTNCLVDDSALPTVTSTTNKNEGQKVTTTPTAMTTVSTTTAATTELPEDEEKVTVDNDTSETTSSTTTTTVETTNKEDEETIYSTAETTLPTTEKLPNKPKYKKLNFKGTEVIKRKQKLFTGKMMYRLLTVVKKLQFPVFWKGRRKRRPIYS